MNLADLLKKSLDSTQLDLIQRIADESSTFGFPLYLVGGSIRDLLLARPIGDLDLTVEGDAIKLGRAIVKKHGGELTVHEKFATATWLFQSPISSLDTLATNARYSTIANLQVLDLISARKETYSQPGALPIVEKSTIDDDLRRRDFTINAMAIRVDGDHFGELHDPLHGQADLENKLIRFLHKRSFIDDPTRMFRALRYSMRYQFSIEPETRDALFDNEARVVLSQLSGERIRHEFDMIFEEDRPLLALAALEDGSGLTNVIHPAFQNVRAMAVSYLDDAPEEGFGEFAIPEILSLRQSLGWILYLMILSTNEIDSIAERLAFPVLLTRSVQAASLLLRGLPSFKDWKPSQWTFHLDELPALAVYAVYLVKKESALHNYLAKWQYVKPSITGADLKQRGLEPGPRFGEILRLLRAAWLDGEVQTEADERRLLTTLIDSGYQKPI